MLQLIVVFFGPYYIFGMTLSRDFRMIAVIIAFTINYAAYFAEIFRGGIESIPNGQYEAAQVLGYNRLETFFIIVLPQVVKIVLPSITNEVITLVKDTSLSFVLAIPEMFTVAKQIAAAEASISALLIAGGFYYLFNALVAFVIFSAIKMLKETRGIQIVKGLLVVGALYFVINLLDMHASSFLFKTILSDFIIVLIILFSPEIRHALETMGRRNFAFFNFFGAQQGDSMYERKKAAVLEVCKACTEMSDKKIGDKKGYLD